MDSISYKTRSFENETRTYELFASESLSDVKFLFNGAKEIPAHKLILAMSSTVFHQMFFGESKITGNITIADSTPEAFTEFLQFFYLNKVQISADKIEQLMDLANTYKVPQCLTACSEFLMEIISEDNFCWVYEMALMYDREDLVTLCEEKIRISPKSIFDKSSFRKCNIVALECILAIKLQCDELTIFNACMDWAKEACVREKIDELNVENYKKVLGDCFHLIRFPSMTNKEFCTVLQNYTCFFDVDTLADIFMHITLQRPLEVATQFNPEPRQSELTFIRDHGNHILCNHTIQTHEVMKFSTNQRILLKGILINDRIHNLIKSELLGNMKMYSHGSKAELLLEQMVKLSAVNSNNYAFIKPIIIQPEHKYEIQIVFDAKSQAGFFPVEVLQYGETVIIKEAIEFVFESSPTANYDCVYCGIISGLSFVVL